MRLCSTLLLLAVTVAPSVAQSPPARRLGAEEWRADLNTLARELPRFVWTGVDNHGRGTFDSLRNVLDTNLPILDDDARVFGLATMVAAVGDVQTALQLPTAWRRYAVGTKWFGCTAFSTGPCELRVISASAPMERYLGYRVVAIDGVPVDDAQRRIAPMIPGRLTRGATFDQSTLLFQYPNVLHGAGVAQGSRAAQFTLEDSTGNSIVVAVPTVTPPEAARPWRRAQQREPFARQRPNDPVWWALLPDSQSVYVALRGFPDSEHVALVTDSLIPFAERWGATRIVVDLRRNTGGNYSAVIDRLLPALSRHPVFGARGGLYAITGPGTLGPGAALALSFRSTARAVMVGLPTGMRPEVAAARSQVTLPNSGLVAVMTLESVLDNADGPVGVQPDHIVETTWENFQQGRDVALEWALSQPTSGPRWSAPAGRPAHQRKSAPKRATPN